MSTTQETLPEVVPSAINPLQLLERAVDKGVDVEQLGKLMELQERWQANKAKTAFNHALARFQAECPSMPKDKTIKHGEKVITRYSSLDAIRKTTRPLLEKHGLTATFEIQESHDEERDIIRVGCKVSHVDGHSETTWMSASPDTSGAKNEVQARGSAVSYLMRYTMVGALGITSADEDDDAGATGGPEIGFLIRHLDVFRENYKGVYCIKQGIEDGDYSMAAEAWDELSDEEKRALWRAPTKGSIFTTEERKIMRTKEFQEANRTSTAQAPAEEQ